MSNKYLIALSDILICVGSVFILEAVSFVVTGSIFTIGERIIIGMLLIQGIRR